MLLISACASTWERHRQQAAERRAAGDLAGATAAQKWLVEHGFLDAPPSERGPAHDADRMLELAELLGKTGQIGPAIEVYREVLRVDATRLESVLTGIGMLPIPPVRREAYMDELVQNALAINPQSIPSLPSATECWSYTARELRVRRVWTRHGPDGLERHAVYDARPWVYDAVHRSWRADGSWINEAGAEIQLITAPDNPQYRAVIDADGGFYADGVVPPCHLAGWRGPYDAVRRQVYTASRLPGP